MFCMAEVFCLIFLFDGHFGSVKSGFKGHYFLCLHVNLLKSVAANIRKDYLCVHTIQKKQFK